MHLHCPQPGTPARLTVVPQKQPQASLRQVVTPPAHSQREQYRHISSTGTQLHSLAHTSPAPSAPTAPKPHSPLVCGKAAVNPGSMSCCCVAQRFSTHCWATPLLSLLSSLLVLFMLTGCTGNQATMPRPLRQSEYGNKARHA